MKIPVQNFEIDLSGFIARTNGSGFWSSTKKEVPLIKMQLCNFSQNFGELRVYFDLKSWNPKEDGLIYTDKLWLEDFYEILFSIGFPRNLPRTDLGSEIDYSEQGMQGHDYVSLDCGKKFIKSYCAQFEN